MGLLGVNRTPPGPQPLERHLVAAVPRLWSGDVLPQPSAASAVAAYSRIFLFME